MEATEKNITTTGNTTEKNSAQTGKKLSIKSIFLGDFLINDFLRRQAGLLALIIFFTVIYISNRLRKELTDIKYDALTRSSELTERTRQSRIEEYVSVENSALQTSTAPPYIIE